MINLELQKEKQNFFIFKRFALNNHEGWLLIATAWILL